MNLDEDNPCPHCGNIETLTDRTDDDFKSVIPKELQFDFHKDVRDQTNIFVAPTPQEIYGKNDSSTNESLPELPQPVQTKTQPESLPEPPQPVQTKTQPESLPEPPQPVQTKTQPESLPGPPQPVQTKTQPESLPEPPQLVQTKNEPESSPIRVSQDVPLESIFPTLDEVSLDPASQKVYFQLSIEFQIILNKASNYRQGIFRWNLLLPDRLQEYGLTEEAWQRIAALGDADEKIQEELSRLLRSIFG